METGQNLILLTHSTARAQVACIVSFTSFSTRTTAITG